MGSTPTTRRSYLPADLMVGALGSIVEPLKVSRYLPADLMVGALGSIVGPLKVSRYLPGRPHGRCSGI